MSWALVQSLKATSVASTSAISIAASFASSVTTGHRIFVYTSHFSTGTGLLDCNTPTDNQLNTYTKLISGTALPASAELFCDIWTAVTSATGTLTITVTSALASGGELGWTAEEYSGLDTSAGSGCLDKSIAGTGNASNTTNADSGTTAATTGAGQLALSMVGDWGANVIWTVSSGTGFTKNTAASLDVDASAGIAVGNRLSGSGSAEHCVWTNGGSTDTDVAVAAVIKLASGGAAPVVRAVIQGPYSLVKPPPGPAGQIIGTSRGIFNLRFTDGGTGTDALTIQATNSNPVIQTPYQPVNPPLSLVSRIIGIPSITSAIPLADSGTETDALTIVQPTPLADSGAVTDALTIVSAVALADNGTETDLLATSITNIANPAIIQAPYPVVTPPRGPPAQILGPVVVTLAVSLADAGAVTDALTITQPTPLADAGTETDTLTIAQPTPLADSGALADALVISITSCSPVITTALYQPVKPPPGPQAQIIGTPVAAANAVALTDAGTFTDALTIVSTVALTDSGTVTDTLAITQPTALADSGAEADTLTIIQPTPLADGGTETDALTSVATVTLADTGTLADALLVAGGTIPPAPVIIQAPYPVLKPPPGPVSQVITAGISTLAIPLADAGTGIDTAGVVSSVAVTDAAALTDTLAVQSTLSTLPDSGALTDALSIVAATPLVDAGTGTDALGTLQSRALPDGGTATDALTVLSSTALTDSVAGTDTLSIIAPTTLAEPGAGADLFFLGGLQAFQITGAGTGSDLFGLGSFLLFTGTGQCTDLLSVQLPEQLAENRPSDTPWISPADSTVRMSDESWISPADGTIKTSEEPRIWVEGESL